MRTWILIFICFFPAPFYAQVQQQMQQRSLTPEAPAGCFESNKTRGLQAQKAGNNGEAERIFREALNCPEVRTNERYRSELNILIARCTALKRAAEAAKQTGLRGKGRYQPDRKFHESNEADCYEKISQEAEKAFKARFWEDAAALFRAAKSCADADQTKRQAMNDRIEMCRLEAENELLQKERDAVWQARQAIASNRADDAKALLQRGDRTRAYRLADFANSYVAPEDADNPDCLQAMFDAWYYDPAAHYYYESVYKIPFCYQLTDNLGANTQIRFSGKGAQARIYVFAPERHLLHIWQAATLKPERSIYVDTSFYTFDIFPDGRTLLFVSKQGYTLWRSNNQTYRLNLPEGHSYDMDADGRQFHYYDPESLSIQTLTVQDVFGGSKGYQTQRSAATRQRATVPGQPLAFKFRYPDLWLVYPEVVLQLTKKSSEEPWRRTNTWKLDPGPEGTLLNGDGVHIHLEPESRSVIFSSSFETQEWRLPEQSDSLLQPEFRSAARLLGVSGSSREKAYWQYAEQSNSYFISILEGPETSSSFNMLSPLTDDLSAQKGAFSEDMEWFGIANSNGTVKLWNLDKSSNSAIDSLIGALMTTLSPNGAWAASWEEERIAVFDANNLKKARFEIPRPVENMPDIQMGNQWMIYRLNMDSVGIWNWQEGLHSNLQMIPADTAGMVIALGEEKDRVAFNVGNDFVEVRALRTGQLIAAKKFEGIIVHLAFLPGSDELLVVQNIARELFSEAQIIPRIWNIERPKETARVIRLHGAAINFFDIRKDGQQIAFSDGSSIRLYETNNLVDEALLLRPIGEKYITALRFHPNGQSIAAAYNDGAILFWDTESGRIQFQFTPAAGMASTFVRNLSITDDGALLRCNTDLGHYISRVLSPDEIRAQAQDEYRQLLAFTPEEIRDYELASAFDYPGNFERLAASGDFPLIRSFFDYYRTQAVEGNNITRVREYCDRAFRLYIQLEETARQDLHATMLEMYADFSWKLLLRQEIGEATTIAQLLNDYFQKPAEAQLILAHTALLSNDFPGATRHYTNWVVRDIEENPFHFSRFDDLQSDFLQLTEYSLLSAPQTACVCEMFGKLLDIGSICSQVQPTPTAFFDAETKLRWSVFIRLHEAEQIPTYSGRIRTLRQALEDTETLRKRYPAGRTTILTKKAVEALEQTYTAWSGFEQYSHRAVSHLKELEQVFRTTNIPEAYSSQISWLDAQNKLILGNQYFVRGMLDSAGYYYEQTQEAARAVRPTEGEEIERFNNNLLGQLWTQIGQRALALNQPAKARQAFEKANEFLSLGLNTLYLGHAAVLEGQENAAWEAYTGIFQEEQLGLACADLEMLAEHLPAMRERLLNWSPRLRDSILALQPNLDPDAVQYNYALQKINYTSYRHDWPGALKWSETARRSAEAMLNKGKETYQWRELWLNAHINLAYYLLFNSIQDTADLSRTIRYSESADRYIESEYPDYPSRAYLYTNVAHAYWLRNGSGDRDKAIRLYQSFINDAVIKQNNIDGWETLQKDFRDLHEAGIRWPELRKLIKTILPDAQISEQEWLEMGVSPSER